MDHLLAMKVFERVVDENGFAAAARALDISPPVVTRVIAELEDYLGTRLLHRTTRRLSLTEAGEAYLIRVRQILQDVEEADTIASSHTNKLAGRLRVHTLPVLASYVIAPLLSEFRQRYPGIVVDIDVEAKRDLPIEDYDLTLFGADPGFDGDIIARNVIESEAILVASPDYIERRGAPNTLEALAEHDCLQLRQSNKALRSWIMWSDQNPEQKVEVNITPVLVANHTDTLLRAALDGAGITSIALDIAASYLTKGELVRVLSPWITGRLVMYAALPSRKFIPERTRVFLDYMVEYTRKQNEQAMASYREC